MAMVEVQTISRGDLNLADVRGYLRLAVVEARLPVQFKETLEDET